MSYRMEASPGLAGEIISLSWFGNDVDGLEEVAGVKEVWASLLRHCPYELIQDKKQKMCVCMMRGIRVDGFFLKLLFFRC